MAGTIVVFGGAGFIGSHLVRRLASFYSGKVVSIDRREPKNFVPSVEYIKADVRDLATLTVEGPIERIYNLAAVHTTPGHPTHEYYETNILGANQITAFARRHNVAKLTFTSSISVYGPGEDEKSEEVQPNPTSAYGWSKLLAEDIHRVWLSEDPSRTLVICRPAVVFGPGEGGNFTRMANLLRRGFFIFPGRRDTVKACIYVDDLLDAIQYAESVTTSFTLFNGCYADGYTIAEIVEEFRANHFPAARTFTVPKSLVLILALMLKPLSTAGLGIHPDRVTKLIKSTNIKPGWLAKEGQARVGALPNALSRWEKETSGTFL